VKKGQAPLDPPEVTARAAQLAAEGRTQYWIVASLDDLRGILRNAPTDAVYTQAVHLFHRGVSESAAEYRFRLEDSEMRQEAEG
jgi:hypothetical protein